MGSQPPALEKLFDEWAKKHAEKLSTDAPYFMPEQEKPYGGFVRDGIINIESWKKQKVRICFILNEAGGREDMEHYPDDFDLAAEWNERGSFSKFMFKIAVWTKAIQDAFLPPVTYKKSDVSKIRDDLIRSIAVVNIKKSDGQRRSDFERLFNFAVEDAEELKRELEIVNPNIIVCCENLKFLREPFVPKPPKKKAGEESSDTAVVSAETETTVIPAESETTTIPAETETKVESAETETEPKPEKYRHKDESSESALVAAFKPPILPKCKEDGRRNYVFNSDELKQISKFTYIWGSKLVFSMWTPANFMGTISSNTINYYAVREVVRAAMQAFSEKQKKKKLQQIAEENAKRNAEKKAQRKAQLEAEKAAQNAQATATAPAPQPVPTATPQPSPAAAPKPAAVATPKPAAPAPQPAPKVEAPAPQVEPQPEAKPKTRRTTKKTAEANANAEETPKKTTRRTKKTATAETAE